MQGKDIIKHDTKHTNWAVVQRHAWVRKENKSSGNVDRSSCESVKLVSTKYYRSTDSVRDVFDTAVFREAGSGERSKGFLTINNDGHYRVVSSGDFIGLWDELTVNWDIKEKTRAESQRIELERREKRDRAEASLRASVPDIEANLKRAISNLLGATTQHDIYINVNGDWDADMVEYTPRISGRVQLQLEDFQRLLETVYEAQDALA